MQPDGPTQTTASGSHPAGDPGSRRDLEALQKAELHVHLRGAISLRYLRQQIRKYPPAKALASAPSRHWDLLLAHPGIRMIMGAEDPLCEVDRLFQFKTFDQFLAAYLFTGYFVRDIEDFRALVETVRTDLRQQNIAYAEITVSLPEYLQQGIALEDLLAVLGEDGPSELAVRWIIDPVRSLGPEAAEELVKRLLPSRPSSVIGLTLGGAEHLYPPAPFKQLYEIAREGGLRRTVHAGEALGPESVWDALKVLQVERVGHGVRAIEDPALVSYLAERGIPLEVCPTSNIRTGVYGSLREHPVRRLFEAGVPITISTDDPTFFGVSLAGELAHLREMGFSWPEIGGLAANAFRFAFDPRARQRLHSTLVLDSDDKEWLGDCA